MGSSRDWAAKGVKLLGVKAVIAESFERIHRSNLVMMGVVPLEFLSGENASILGLSGKETYDIEFPKTLSPKERVTVKAHNHNGKQEKFETIVRFDSQSEIDDFRSGGILNKVLAEKQNLSN